MKRHLTIALQQLPNIGEVTSISAQGASQWATFYQVSTNDNTFFLKCTTGTNHMDLSLAEVKNLQLLSRSQTIQIPKVYAHIREEGFSAILMEYIESLSNPTTADFRTAGRQLAKLHRCTAPSFGLAYNNYIGSIPQVNNNGSKVAASHYMDDRLTPLLHRALSEGLLSSNEVCKIEGIYHRIDAIIPKEPPALVHGDLWSGNILAGAANKGIYYIDPACAYSIREMDIAMSLLFGGFNQAFYEGYDEIYPLIKGWRTRVPLFQLYYLLVHLLLFGTSYKSAVLRCIKPYQ